MSDPFLITASRKRKKAGFGLAPRKPVNGASHQRPAQRPKTSNQKRKRSLDQTAAASDLSDDVIDPVNTDDELQQDEALQSSSDEDNADETPAEKRLRLAKEYLDKVKNEIDDSGFDAADIDRELIADRLKKDAMELTGRFHKEIAHKLRLDSPVKCIRRWKGHHLPLTAVAISPKHDIFYTAGKEGAIKKWSLKGNLLHSIPKVRFQGKKQDISGHFDTVFCLALSPDGQFLASGGKDKRIIIWSTADDKAIKCFTQHRDSVTSLCFRHKTNQLYSAALDRTIRLWDLDQMTYVETLFGHQDSIVSIDALAREQCVSAGCRDRTCRVWNITEETHMVFRGGGTVKDRDLRRIEHAEADSGHDNGNKDFAPARSYVEGSMDTVAMIDEEHWISGSDNGSISLWATTRKKPVFVYPLAHGLEQPPTETQTSAEDPANANNFYPPSAVPKPRWITSLAAVNYADVFASGSWDGSVRLWKLQPDLKSFAPLATVNEIPGVVNSMRFLQDTSFNKAGTADSIKLLVGVGQEHRLGRWLRIKKAKNVALLIEFDLIAVSEQGQSQINGIHA